MTAVARAGRASGSVLTRARIAALPPSAFARPRHAMGRAARRSAGAAAGLLGRVFGRLLTPLAPAAQAARARLGRLTRGLRRR
ncbi:hypothetical protein [Sinomonas sp. P47F7]|uniref:hypothetical protein n=1 Tax=Sinomonas sp. P47F7 TaxID=3410987 RepID=UPI003BF514EC